MCSEGMRYCPCTGWNMRVLTYTISVTKEGRVSHRSLWFQCAIGAATLLMSTALPAADLNFMRDTPMTYLTDADRKLQREAALSVLEHERANAVREWSNPATGASGRIEGQGDLIADDGLRCRKIRIVAQAKGAESVFALPVCKDTKGQWFFGSGLKLSPAKNTERPEVAVVRY